MADHSLFSVSGGFTQGNLQATWDGSAWTWAFAANQYDFIDNLDIIVLFFSHNGEKGGKIEYGEMKKMFACAKDVVSLQHLMAVSVMR